MYLASALFAFSVEMSVAAGVGSFQRSFSAAHKTVERNYFWRLFPFSRSVVLDETLPAESTSVKAVRHFAAGRAFRVYTSVVVLLPSYRHRLLFSVWFVIIGWLMFASIASLTVLTNQVFIPITGKFQFIQLEFIQFYQPPKAAPGTYSPLPRWGGGCLS